jgi:mRNA guanylyltransferase
MDDSNQQIPDPDDYHFDPTALVARVGGVWAGNLQRGFQYEVAELLQRRNTSFPGAQPVSFSARHIAELKKEDYFVCEKTDGIRYLMWLTRERTRPLTYLIDRKNDYYFVNGVYFPHHEDKSGRYERFHDQTILDGELVEDHISKTESVMKFLVFDCLILDGNSLMHRPLDKRLAYFKSFVLEPYRAMLKANPPKTDEEKPPFTVEDKSTEFSYGLEKMFKEIIPKVKQLHGNDGLIFTCKDTPYHPGTDQHILKWKPPGENTVDFLLHITWPTSDPDQYDPDQSPQEDYLAFPEDFGLYVNYGGRSGVNEYERHGTLYVPPEEWEHLKSLGKPLQDAIVECYQEEVPAQISNGSQNGSHDNTNGNPTRRWRFHRLRDDKQEANHITTFNSVIDSIEDHVTEDDLLKQAEEIRSCWKARDAARRGRGAQGGSQQR